MSEKRIVFTGGGTAGHVMVNIAIIPMFIEQGWKIDYLGSKAGIERELIGKLEGVTYHSISTGKLRRYMSIENFKDPFKVLKGIEQAYRILRKIKPNVIFSKGGFVSVPVLIAARMKRIPSVIHESDITPGLANKLAMPFAKKILATFPETMQYLPEKKTEWIGAIVRLELLQGAKQKGFVYTGLKGIKPILLIMGGSAGAQRINQAVRSEVEILTEQFEIIHICGKDNLDKAINVSGYTQFEYVHSELSDLFAITDFVLSRAGANAIFEFLALRKPMLLIPLSRQVSRGDQILNAESFQKQGYAHVLEEEELTGETLIHALKQLKEQGTILKKNMQKYESHEARDKVIKIIKETAKY